MFKSIRPFIGAKDYKESKEFYKELGFNILEISDSLSYFRINEKLGFYLQKAFIKEWIDNTMLFVEVEKLETYFIEIKEKELPSAYANVKLSKIVKNDWGKEFFLHDPSGILWHFGTFKE
jgi:catechol 2,3-dioxygenase-like lactoylglutathione lyase family enzyme